MLSELIEQQLNFFFFLANQLGRTRSTVRSVSLIKKSRSVSRPETKRYPHIYTPFVPFSLAGLFAVINQPPARILPQRIYYPNATAECASAYATSCAYAAEPLSRRSHLHLGDSYLSFSAHSSRQKRIAFTDRRFLI